MRNMCTDNEWDNQVSNDLATRALNNLISKAEIDVTTNQVRELNEVFDQLTSGQGNYTKDRRQWLDKLSLENIFSEIEKSKTNRTQ